MKRAQFILSRLPFEEKSSAKARSAWIGNLIKTIAILIAALGVCQWIQDFHPGAQNLIMIYVLAVLVISWMTEGYFFGLLSTVASVLAFDSLATQPIGKLTPNMGSGITFVVMLVISLSTTTVTMQIRAQKELAVSRKQKVEVLYAINQQLLAARGLASIVELAVQLLVCHIERSIVFYVQSPQTPEFVSFRQAPDDAGEAFFRQKREHAAAQWAYDNQKSVGLGENEEEPICRSVYLPVYSKGSQLGVIGFSCSKGPLKEFHQTLLHAVVIQVSLALELHYMSEKQKEALIKAEEEKMRGNLLRAISHDLRTPLTSILGASSVLLEGEENLDVPLRDKLVRDIKEDSEWLIRMVENILSVTRIHGDTTTVTKTLEAAEEVVAQAITVIRKRFPNREIQVAVPQELLMIPMDATLISQVLINLLENAVKFSEDDTVVCLNVTQQEKNALFEVLDSGTGISPAVLPNLFTMRAAAEKKVADSSRGMGIGLSICMSIIDAHHGTIAGFNREEGGAAFRFVLPLEE